MGLFQRQTRRSQCSAVGPELLAVSHHKALKGSQKLIILGFASKSETMVQDRTSHSSQLDSFGAPLLRFHSRI